MSNCKNDSSEGYLWLIGIGSFAAFMAYGFLTPLREAIRRFLWKHISFEAAENISVLLMVILIAAVFFTAFAIYAEWDAVSRNKVAKPIIKVVSWLFEKATYLMVGVAVLANVAVVWILGRGIYESFNPTGVFAWILYAFIAWVLLSKLAKFFQNDLKEQSDE